MRIEMAATSSTARTEFFKELKPRCIAINDLAVKAPDKRAVAKQLITVTEDLSIVIERQIKKDASVLDDKLADYVFFPLSNILRNQQQFPIRLTEITIKCLENLIRFGWKSKISAELSQQLLIFLTYVVGGVPGKDQTSAVPEETTLEGLKALTALITATGASTPAVKALLDDKNIPALGHTITTVLDISTLNGSTVIQLEALQVLDAIITGIKNPVALAMFLPGIVSSLSKLLTPPPAWKVPRKVLVKGTAVLRSVLVAVLGDINITRLLKKPAESEDVDRENSEEQVFTVSWLKATAEQVKIALASVLKLRTHKAGDVRSALERLCIALLDECHQSLSTCAQILVESAMILSTEEENQSLLKASLNTTLPDLTGIYPELTDTVKTAVYNWVTSLPRIIQSSDEEVKQQAIRNLLKGQRLMNSLHIDSSTLTNTMAVSLRDSVTVLLASSNQIPSMTELPSAELVLSQNNISQPSEPMQFRPLILNQTDQKSIRAELLELISKSGTFAQHLVLATDMLEHLRESTGNVQVASYWLAFELVKAGLSASSDIDEFIDFGSSAGDESHEEIFQELYAFSITVLNSSEDVDDSTWRLQSVALEVAAFAASRMKIGFRPELIDVLYPIATYLGSSVPQLREHAIMALNSIASSCGYDNVSDLVIENADYMLNSVSLRLNTFDISPASTQVLRMMIRLTGPRIIPFLDDVVASIFGALDNYHGYTLLVESLFTVLAEIVRQGAGSDQLLLVENTKTMSVHTKHPPRAAQVEDIRADLERYAKRRRQREAEVDVERISHPKKPWSRGKEQDGDNDENDDLDEEPSGEVEKKPLSKTPTYTLLTRIMSFTQHYLTSPSATLRKSLLDLLAIVCPALSPDEEAFLPVVNTVWPVLVERLYDSEPFVVISTCKALTALCGSAGDFLSSRIETEWSDGLGKWIEKAKGNMVKSSKAPGRKIIAGRSSFQAVNTPDSELVIPIRSADGLHANEPLQTTDLTMASPSNRSGLGEYTQARQIWDAVQELLIGIVSFVRINDDIFEHILMLFGAEGIVGNDATRRALEVVNADAVWLALYEAGRADLPSLPSDVMQSMGLIELRIA